MGVRIGRRRLLVLVGAVAAVAVVLGAVFVWPGGSADPPPAAEQARPKPVLTPLRLSDRPVWTSSGAVEYSASNVEVIGETMLIFEGGGRITTVDTATGKAVWKLSKGHDLTGRGGVWLGGADVVVTDGGAPGLFVGWQYTDDCTNPPGSPDGRGVCHAGAADQAGLALVSATDGRTVWENTIIPSYPAEVDYATRPELLIEVVTDRVALVSIGVGMDSFRHTTPPARTIAVDVRTGATLWESQDGAWPEAIVGDTVLSEVRTQSADGPEWTAVAADLGTGRQTWARAGGLDRAEVEQVAGEVALVRGVTDEKPERQRYVVVEVATGRTVTEFDHPEYITSCADDNRTLIACALRDNKTFEHRVTVFRLDKRTVTTVPVSYGGDIRADEAWSGRVQLSGTPRGEQDRRTFTMDSAGNVIDKDLRLPGGIEVLTDDRATVITEDGLVEVYQVLR